MVSVMSSHVPVFLVYNLEVEVTLVEEVIVVELMDMGEGDAGKTTVMFMGIDLHS